MGQIKRTAMARSDLLSIIAHWLRHFGCDDAEVEAARGDALVWALERGSRSGRVAYQFARDRAGRIGGEGSAA